VKIRILVMAAALAAAAGCAGSGGTTVGAAAPLTGSASPATPVATNPTTTTTQAPTSPAGPTGASSEPPATGGPTASEPASSGGGTVGSGTRCHTSQLAASFRASDPGAGQRYATLLLTNRSQRTCTVFGYGGLQPLDAGKKQLPVTLSRDTGHPARLVRLAPGASVGRTIHWTVVPGGPPCVAPAYAAIIPPDETDPLVTAWSLGPVCGGRMDGWPYGVTL
jgi:Protein of unknown function (DUF4232)